MYVVPSFTNSLAILPVFHEKHRIEFTLETQLFNKQTTGSFENVTSYLSKKRAVNNYKWKEMERCEYNISKKGCVSEDMARG